VAEIDDIVHSWKDALVLREEEDKNLGFRSVQVGAISAIKAHFISKPERKAIVVMPTGTGKDGCDDCNNGWGTIKADIDSCSFCNAPSSNCREI
jgi:hypothetical protein